MVFLAMKRFFLIFLAFAAVSCVGQLDDDDPSGGGGSTTPAEGAGIVLDFTATWCVNCPRMHQALEDAQAARPGKIIPISVHFQDAMVCEDGQALISHFGVEAYPSAVANMDATTLITATSKDLLLAKLDATVSAKKPCTLEATKADGGVTVRVTAAEAGAYTLSVALLEDGIVAAQTGASENYVHDNVFRGFLQENLLGDALGQLEAGQAVERSFALPADATRKLRLVAFVCYDGVVNATWAEDQN